MNILDRYEFRQILNMGSLDKAPRQYLRTQVIDTIERNNKKLMDIVRAISYSNKLMNDDETIYFLLYIAPKKKKITHTVEAA